MANSIAALLLAVLAGPVHAASSGAAVGFDGAFSSGTWRVGQNPPKEIVIWSPDGASVLLKNHAAWAESGSTIEHPASQDAEVKFHFYWHVDSPRMIGSCPGAYIVNGAYTVITNPGGGQDQNGPKSFTVKAGDTFGFALNGDGTGQQTAPDCLNQTGGPSRGLLTISNFQFIPQ